MCKVRHRAEIYPGVPRAVRAQGDARGREAERRHERDAAEGPLLFEGAEWDFDTIQRIHDAIAEIAEGELGLDTYPNQIEIITTEQMLDAYSSVGMPLFYKHW